MIMAIRSLLENQIPVISEYTMSGFDISRGFSAFFKESFLDRKNWAALLYECDLKADATKVAHACHNYSYVKAFCFNIDHNNDETYSIDLCEADLSRVHKFYVSPSYAIVEENERFIIVSDSDYYWGIAGSLSFIENIANGSIEEELKLFASGIDPYVTSVDSINNKIGMKMLSYLEICHSRLAKIRGE